MDAVMLELVVKDGILFELTPTTPEGEAAIRQIADSANERSEGRLTLVGIRGKTLMLISNKL